MRRVLWFLVVGAAVAIGLWVVVACLTMDVAAAVFLFEGHRVVQWAPIR